MDDAGPQAFSLDRHFAFRLNRTWDAVSAWFAEPFTLGVGLKRQEWFVLLAVQEGVTTQGLIGQTTGLRKVPVSRAVLALKTMGLVAKSGASGRNGYSLMLTPIGSSLVARGLEAVRVREAQLLRSFTQDEIRQLQSLLDRLDAARVTPTCGYRVARPNRSSIS